MTQAGEDDRRMIGALLRIPREAALRQVVAGLAAADFGDVRPAHFTVFQHIPSADPHLARTVASDETIPRGS